MLTIGDNFWQIWECFIGKRPQNLRKLSFVLASDDQLLLFSEEFTQILSSWAAKWVSGVVIVVELIKLYYLAAWQW